MILYAQSLSNFSEQLVTLFWHISNINKQMLLTLRFASRMNIIFKLTGRINVIISKIE